MTLNDIYKVIDWYESISADEAFNDVGTLMRTRALLSAYSVKFARKIKEDAVSHRTNDFRYSVECKRRVIELMAKTDPHTQRAYTSAKANQMIEVEMSEMEESVEVADAMLDGNKIILKQVNHVLEAMRQDIAEMRVLRDDKCRNTPAFI